MIDIARNCRRVLERIGDAAVRCGRSPDSIRLVAVTKSVPIEHIKEAVACGITHVGENRLQEALPKREALSEMNLTWHFIGHLQTNKAKKVAERFHWVHSIDRLDLAQSLARYIGERALPALPVLVEVKLHDEPKKSGVDPSELSALVASLRAYEQLQMRGLMVIPPPSDDVEQIRPYFRRLRELAGEFGLTELSMGMTQDFEVAIEEGATMVRVGTGLFGERQ